MITTEILAAILAALLALSIFWNNEFEDFRQKVLWTTTTGVLGLAVTCLTGAVTGANWSTAESFCFLVAFIAAGMLAPGKKRH